MTIELVVVAVIVLIVAMYVLRGRVQVRQATHEIGRIGQSLARSEAQLARNLREERQRQTPRIQAYRKQRNLRLTEPMAFMGVEDSDESGGEAVVVQLPTNGSPTDLTPRQRRRVTHKRLHLDGVTEEDIYGTTEET